FSAETSVFVRTGASVQLDLQTQERSKINVFLWEKDKSNTIATYIIATKQVLNVSSYENRVKFNTETFSITLKNMMKTDNGLYTARSIEENDIFFAKYRVTVLDAVEVPIMTVNSNQSSGDSCTVNFTCRSHSLTLNSTYNSGSCSQMEVSYEVNFLILDCSQKSIICNHSNPVSWNHDRINVAQLCFFKDQTPKKEEKKSTPWWIVFVVLGVLIILILAGFIYCKCIKGAQKEVEGTVYAQVEGQEMQKLNSDCHTYDTPDRVQDQTQKEPADERPETTYCTVGQHQKPRIPPETDHTIYSAVFKQSNKKPPAISSDDASK
ncbi:hypothetical protein QQF64_015622, partial [Cirrhinus molitorella]